MSSATLTLYGCYNFNRSLFDEMVLPEGVEKNLVIDSIIMRGGEYEVLYSNPEMLQGLIGSWSKRWLSVFSNWQRATVGMDDIRPLDNYDRNEVWSDKGTTHSKSTDSMTGNGSTSGHDSSHGSAGTTSTDKISADDTNDFVNRTQNIQNNTTDTTAEATTTSSTNTTTNAETNGNTDTTHEGHVWGNIGVTTSAQMFKEFYDIMGQYGNIYESIATVFLQAFVIPII